MPFFVAIALALVLTWAARWLGLTTGLVDRPLVVEPEGERPPGADEVRARATIVATVVSPGRADAGRAGSRWR